MIELNEQQKKAVEFMDGPCLVTSCPGSGKTRVLVERAIRLLEKGVPPKNILCITFTNKASKEMKNRIYDRLGDANQSMFIGTFHSFCASIIRAYYQKLGYLRQITILDQDGQKSLLKKCARSLGYDIKEDKIDIEYIMYRINTSRELNEDAEELEERFKDKKNHFDISEEYFKNLKQANLVDFSGLLYQTIKLLEDNTDVLDRLQNIFKYIQVDEVQDTNYAQFRIIELLSGKYKNIMLIGDLDQSIYKFRGARYQNMIDFLNMHPDCTKIPLGKNYRSTPQIISVADKLINKNSSHIDNDFFTDNSHGEDVSCNHFDSQYAEADWVKSKIKEYVQDLGWDYSDIAILYRLNKLSVDMQTSFAKDGISYCVIGGPNYFNRKEIKDCISMLDFMVNRHNTVAFHKILSTMSDVGDQTVASIEKYAETNKEDLYESCKKLVDTKGRRVKKASRKIVDVYSSDFSGKHGGECLEKMLTMFGYFQHLNSVCKNKEEFEERRDNVNELIIHATEFGKINPNIKDYLNNIALITDGDKEAEHNAVTLMTVHASKGLEFPIVFMIGMERDIFPHYRALLEADNDEQKVEAMEEERRICYVGMTRAMKHLSLSYCKIRKKRVKNGIIEEERKYPSCFLLESGLINNEEYESCS